MSGTQRTLYPVADWLAALEHEQRRLMRIYIAMDVAIALAGLAMIGVSLLWALPKDYSITAKLLLGSFVVLVSALGSPLVILPFNAKVSATAMAHVEQSGLSQAILNGTVTGDELRNSLPKWLRWLARPNPEQNPANVMRRVVSASYIYQGLAGVHWCFIVLPVLYACVSWGMADFRNVGPEEFPPLLVSMCRFQEVFLVISNGIAMPLIWLLGPRINTLFVVLLVLKRQWEAELARSADVG